MSTQEGIDRTIAVLLQDIPAKSFSPQGKLMLAQAVHALVEAKRELAHTEQFQATTTTEADTEEWVRKLC